MSVKDSAVFTCTLYTYNSLTTFHKITYMSVIVLDKSVLSKRKALARFEPAISCLLDRRFNQLSHRATVS